MRTWTIPTAVLLALAVLAAPGRACENPVYRIFYERELPPNYSLVYYHADGAEAEPGLAAELDRLVDERGYTLNATIVKADLDEREDWHEGSREFLFYELLGRPEPPFMVLAAPDAEYVRPEDVPADAALPPGVLYAGAPPAAAELSAMISSPARRRVARMLAAGRHGVLVLLEGAGPLQNDAAAAAVLLATHDDLDDEGQPIDSGFVRVDPRDPAERWFVRQLRRHPLAPPGEGPMLFAMFGRGLVLQPMFGPELNPETVEFVVTGILNAPCTCVARDQLMAMTQPILLDFDWDKKPDEPAEDDAIVGAMPVPHFGPLWAGAAALVPTGVPMAPVAVCAAERSGPFFAHLRSRGPGISTGVRNTGRSVVAGLSDAIVAGGGPVTAPQETAPSGGRSIVVSVLTVLAVLAVVVFLGTFIIMTRKYTA